MKLTFLGAAHEVTGSKTLLTACGHKILIDCGMEQGSNSYENAELPIAPGEIDCALLTHAHIDHSGKLPLLVSEGFSGRIYATRATTELCNIMLRDSAHIQEFEAEWRNRKAKRSGKDLYHPLYTMDDVSHTLPLFSPCDYNDEYDILDGIKIQFIDAGHLLGSSSIKVTVTEDGKTQSIIFSGDVGNVDRPLIRNPDQPQLADFVVIESTYGDRLHGPRVDYIEQLRRVIQNTFDNGGNVVIPSFAVGRTQELLYIIRKIKEDKLIQNHDGFLVYLDSPLAIEATNIYSKNENMMKYYDSETLDLLQRGINPISFDGLKISVTSDESKLINDNKSPKVIISASGMCEAGRIRHHLKHNLWCEECTILFVGYQAEGTLGRIIVDGATEVKLFGEQIEVRANIEQIDGISGHADRDMLLGWLKGFKNPPLRIFVNHGDDFVCEKFAMTVEEQLHINAVAPYSGGIYDLTTGECLETGNTVRIEKAKQPVRAVNNVFERLRMAGKKLLAVIEQNEGGANKDLAKFTDQINSLCEKWKR
ncbi:MAG: MBL fold metallo-hydrolase [Oscillospiraceae bacterium]|nr:MBL fold metallo-hydrolase [Oscillospiraceae bacterium]